MTAETRDTGECESAQSDSLTGSFVIWEYRKFAIFKILA